MKLTKEQQQEIQDLQSQEFKTKRVTAPELEKILFEAIPVLDHGFIRVVDYMGDDTSIVQAARVSYGKGTKKVLDLLKGDAERTYDNYENMLNERYDGSVIDETQNGLARELARMNLTLGTYTQWYWKTDLLNLMNFLRLRADHHAQYEIRAYADVMLDTLKRWVPITYEAFLDYRVGGTEVSSKGKKVLKKLISGEIIDLESSGLSKREWNELMEAFEIKDKTL